FFQTILKLGATWRLVLGIVFVLLVVFLRRGLAGAITDLYHLARSGRKTAPPPIAAAPAASAPAPVTQGAMTVGHKPTDSKTGPLLQAIGLTKRYGGLVANSEIDFTVNHGEIRGVIGPNGAGKSTFFKMLTCEVIPSSGKIVFDGRDITDLDVADACQVGLTKSYQINQLFERLTVRQNLTIAALGEIRGKFRLDMFRSLAKVPGLDARVESTAARDRAGAGDIAQPVAARRAACRHEHAGARRDRGPAQIDRPGTHDDHHRPRHGFAVRTG